MLCVLKRTASMRLFFWARKAYVQTDGLDNTYNFTLKNGVYLNLCKILSNDLTENTYIWQPFLFGGKFKKIANIRDWEIISKK